MYENINQFMDSFEKTEAVKKEKRKQQKSGLTSFFVDTEE
jgi:hypothetical protein